MRAQLHDVKLAPIGANQRFDDISQGLFKRLEAHQHESLPWTLTRPRGTSSFPTPSLAAGRPGLGCNATKHQPGCHGPHQRIQYGSSHSARSARLQEEPVLPHRRQRRSRSPRWAFHRNRRDFQPNGGTSRRPVEPLAARVLAEPGRQALGYASAVAQEPPASGRVVLILLTHGVHRADRNDCPFPGG